MSDKLKMKPLTFNFSELSEVDNGDSKDRKFRGVAYSGAVIPQWGWHENIIVDLEGASFKDQVPILLNHDPDQIAGHANFSIVDNEVIAEGVIYVDEPAGERIQRLADKGHKWEMSIYAQGESVLLLGENEKKMVNGRLLEGQHHIIQKPSLREASFVTFGADQNTNASLFSRLFGGSKEKEEGIELKIVNLNENNKSEENIMDEIQELTKKNEELSAKLAEATEKLAAIETEKLEAEVEAKLSEKVIEDEDKEMLKAAFMSGSETEIKMAEKLLVTFADVEAEGEEDKEEEDAEAKAEEAAKAELAAKAAEEAKAKLPENLFTAEKGEDKALAEFAASKKDLYTLGKELAEKEGISLTEAIVKVRKAQVQ